MLYWEHNLKSRQAFKNLLSRPIENAIAFDCYQSGLNARERPWLVFPKPSIVTFLGVYSSMMDW